MNRVSTDCFVADFVGYSFHTFPLASGVVSFISLLRRQVHPPRFPLFFSFDLGCSHFVKSQKPQKPKAKSPKSQKPKAKSQKSLPLKP